MIHIKGNAEHSGATPMGMRTDALCAAAELQQKLLAAAKKLKIKHRSMISGAGHDAMSFANICETAMMFIPCAKGISHNKKEFATIESICDGAQVIYEHFKEEMEA